MLTNKLDTKEAPPAGKDGERYGFAKRLDQIRLVLMLALALLVLGGSFVFHSEWTIWSWLFIGGVVLAWLGWYREWRQAWSQSVVIRGLMLWTSGMLLISLMRAGWEGGEMGSPRSWAWGSMGLLAWGVALHGIGRDGRWARWLGASVVSLAAFSAAFSVVHYGWLKPDWHWGMRLSNGLVYGGWNQVCSGVTWAFAAVWALVLAGQPSRARWERWLFIVAHLLLLFVAMATLSRGALLVLLVGHGCWVLSFGRKAWPGVIRFGVVMALFHLVMPSLVKPGGPETEVSRRYPRVIDANPLKEWTKRADTGRFEMYAAVAKALTEGKAGNTLFGFGEWASNEPWHRHLKEEQPMHPHSVFAGTALQGGVVGLVGLLVVLGLGLRTAWSAGRAAGWPGYFVLALAGLAGVTFDGHSLATLNSIPRFEPLLVWTALLLASGQVCGPSVGVRSVPTAMAETTEQQGY